MRVALFASFFLVFAIFALSVVPAMAQQDKSPVVQEAPIRVAFINPGYGTKGFWKDVRDTMQAAADQFGYELIVFDSDRSWSKMADSAQRAFALQPEPDYIIAVNEHQLGTRIVLEAEQRGIPVLMLLNDLTYAQKQVHGRPGKGLDQWILTLTPDNEQAGFDIARSLVDAERMKHQTAMPDALCLLSIAGDSKTPASLQRLAGLDLALVRFPVLGEQRRVVANWSFNEAYRHTSAWLERDGCLDVIWAANDDIALGAIKALEEHGLEAGHDVFVGGLNWSERGVNAVSNGQMTMTHGGHFLAGGWIMVLLHDYIAGVDALQRNAKVSFRMSAITPDTIGLFQKVLGSRDWTKIDFSHFSLVGKSSGTEYDFSLENIDRALGKAKKIHARRS